MFQIADRIEDATAILAVMIVVAIVVAIAGANAVEIAEEIAVVLIAMVAREAMDSSVMAVAVAVETSVTVIIIGVEMLVAMRDGIATESSRKNRLGRLSVSRKYKIYLLYHFWLPNLAQSQFY